MDNEVIRDIDSEEENNMVDIFKRPHRMKKYLLLCDKNDPNKEDKIIRKNGMIFQLYEERTPLFLVTKNKGKKWQAIKQIDNVPSIKVIGLTKTWRKEYYYLTIIVEILDRYNEKDKEVVGKYNLLVKSEDLVYWRKKWLRAK